MSESFLGRKSGAIHKKLLIASLAVLMLSQTGLAEVTDHSSSWGGGPSAPQVKAQNRRQLPEYYYSYYSNYYGDEVEMMYNYDNGEYYSSYFGYYQEPYFYSYYDTYYGAYSSYYYYYSYYYGDSYSSYYSYDGDDYYYYYYYYTYYDS